MKDELNSLIQEIVDFSNILAFTDNTGDSNFRNACQLFSGYLDNRFTELKTASQITDEIDWAASEITKLSGLISLQQNASIPDTQWIQNLSQYCEELQQNKIAAA